MPEDDSVMCVPVTLRAKAEYRFVAERQSRRLRRLCQAHCRGEIFSSQEFDEKVPEESALIL